MKKIIIASAVLFSVAQLSAQDLDLRIYGGTNVLQLSTDNSTNIIDGVLHNTTVSGRPGYQFGVAATIGKRFYIQPGIQYTDISTEIVNENNKTGYEFKDKTQLQILTVPLHVGFKVLPEPMAKIVNFRLFGGFSGHHVLAVNHHGISGEITEITKDDYSNLIMSADFGMGIDVWFLFLDLNYGLGLSPVHTANGDGAKANSFNINLGLKFGF